MYKIKRILGTGFAFIIIGLFGLLMCVFIFPLIHLFQKDQFKKQVSARHSISTAFSIYLKILQALNLCIIQADELKKIQNLRGHIIICNHPTLLDVVIIMASLKGIQCVVKKELWKNWFLGGVVRNARYIRNDVDPDIFLQMCQETLENGENLLIFPEGTRSIAGKSLVLKRGLANMAFYTKKEIQSLFIECTPVMLTKGEKWYTVPEKTPVFSVRVGPTFNIDYYQKDAPRSIRVRLLTADIQHYYNKEMGYE
ncbi:MAG: hypothetical protein CNLJKLNK_00522 [Holosporales bacterium]